MLSSVVVNTLNDGFLYTDFWKNYIQPYNNIMTISVSLSHGILFFCRYIGQKSVREVDPCFIFGDSHSINQISENPECNLSHA